MAIKKKTKSKIEQILIFTSVLLLMLNSILPASADIYLNYSNATGTKFNYSFTSNTSRMPSFINLSGGDIEMPSATLKVYINNVNLTSGSKFLTLTGGSFGPYTTSDIPKQKVYVASSGNVIVNYAVKAHSAFANYGVNISTYKQISSNVPFYSDLSVALLDFNDLKNKWSDDSIVLNELINTTSDSNLENLTTATLDSSGDYTGSLSLPAGNYLMLVTNGTDPKQVITSTIIKVMPFNSTITVPTTGTIGTDVSVSVSLTGAPSQNYTFISSIIKWTDYNSKIGDVNISWTSGNSLVESVRINGTLLDTANSLTDIIPNSNTTRNTTNATTKTLALNTASLPAGSYFVHTVVYNNSNETVAFKQSSITLSAASTPPSSSGGSDSSTSVSGGGSPSSSEKNSNIASKEKYEQYIAKDKTTTYKFATPENPLMFININGKTNAGAITVLVEVLKGTSTLANKPAPGRIYKNLNIWVGTKGFPNSNYIRTAVIGFKVENSWLKDNGFSSKDILLVKWDGSEWIPLETKEIEKSGEFTKFEGTANSFSPFSIVVKEPETSGTPAITPEIVKTPATGQTPVETQAEVTKGSAKPAAVKTETYLMIAAAIFVIVILAMYVMKKKK